jgi:hypothetical protein
MRKKLAVAVAAASLVAGGSVANGPVQLTPNRRPVFHVSLDGYQEVLPVSTTGRGTLSVHVAPDGQSLGYSLSYSNLVGDVAQAHIHFGRPAINGGIMVFLCTNLGNGPAGTPLCPGPHDGEVSGTLDASDVVAGASAQGIDAGEFAEVIATLRSRSAYGNVHSSLYPAGEVRGNFR